jgi:chemotaxis protein histidine kinase CheA
MMINVHHHHHNHQNEGDAERLRLLFAMLGLVINTMEKFMSKLDDVLKDVTDESTQIDGLSALIAGLQDQVKAAVATSNMSAADTAKIDAIFDEAEKNRQKIATALNANTPATAAAAATDAPPASPAPAIDPPADNANEPRVVPTVDPVAPVVPDATTTAPADPATVTAADPVAATPSA